MATAQVRGDNIFAQILPCAPGGKGFRPYQAFRMRSFGMVPSGTCVTGIKNDANGDGFQAFKAALTLGS